jgi:hypothetical protein
VNGVINGHRSDSDLNGYRLELSEQVDRDHLLAQIAQGLLTAHARLDLMDERLKEAQHQSTQAASQATADRNTVLATLDSTTRELRAALERLQKEEQDHLCGLEQRVMDLVYDQAEATRCDLGKQLGLVRGGLEAVLQSQCSQLQRTIFGAADDVKQAIRQEAQAALRRHRALVWTIFLSFCAVLACVALPLAAPQAEWLPKVPFAALLLTLFGWGVSWILGEGSPGANSSKGSK